VQTAISSIWHKALRAIPLAWSICGTQTGSCQSTCLAISSGAATTSVTVVVQRDGSDPVLLNCTSQELICEQGCTQQQLLLQLQQQ